jgi:alkylresorcinol/alkylpyrone synthase
MPVIASIGTANPPNGLPQDETKDYAGSLFKNSFSDIERLLKVFDSCEIDKRYFCKPREWFEKEHTWKEKNTAFIENAILLGTEAINTCLQKVNLTSSDIDIIVFITSTGVSTPSIDAHIYNILNMKPGLIRVPVWGLGCAGGVAGLARGRELATAYPNSRIIVCCVELCSLTFMYNDRSKANLIATSLFADGAAAVLILGDKLIQEHNNVPPGTILETGPDGRYPKIISSQSYTWNDSLDVMGWDVQNDGLMVIFSGSIPAIITQSIKPQVECFLHKNNLSPADITRYIAHPGGMKVLKAYEAALDIEPGQLDTARYILRNYGNMSSCTVYYVLEEELKKSHKHGEYGLVFAVGPGFSCEQVLIQW